ncbi:Endoribonuclease L-PSP [Rhizobium mongolense subsp. loessense]|uniref:Endoribonuclease L-PSP n=1 Tax=Rhizobium mongolense subsp. loessense TaxID=158890 RepID=A0A1G4R0J0_9HYPH|nr:Rid family hydrolase [Rhizobium mongolense]SCW50175.1 Endoribonuclease L-PSP [Rhizobium mongolense subsp. loessense]
MIQRYKKGSRMSQAVSYGGLVYIAGQVAENRKAGIEDQTRDVLGKIDVLLKEAGIDRSRPHRRRGLPAGDRRFRCDEQRLSWLDRRRKPAGPRLP